MRINIRTPAEVELLRQAGHIVALCHAALKETIRPGIDGLALDALVESLIRAHRAEPVFKGYRGYPNATCISVNETVVHGIPNARPLQAGDVVGVDIGVRYQGYVGDGAWTYPVGKISREKTFLLTHTEQALWAGLRAVRAGVHLSNVSNAIGQYAARHNLGIVKELSGHGVGTQLHEPPTVLNYGPPNRGPLLQAGMVLAVEPMLNLGSPGIKTLRDGWAIVTKDGKPSAHFEHTVVVNATDCTVLTALR